MNNILLALIVTLSFMGLVVWTTKLFNKDKRSTESKSKANKEKKE